MKNRTGLVKNNSPENLSLVFTIYGLNASALLQAGVWWLKRLSRS